MSQTSILAGSLFNPIISRGSFFPVKCLGLSDGDEDEEDEDDEILLVALDDDEVKSFFIEVCIIVYSLTRSGSGLWIIFSRASEKSAGKKSTSSIAPTSYISSSLTKTYYLARMLLVLLKDFPWSEYRDT